MPITAPGRIIILTALVVLFVTLPQQTNRLVTLLAKQSEWVRSSYTGSSSASHIVICGAVNQSGLEAMEGPITTFTGEFFDEDHGNAQNRYAVLLSKGQPCREIQMLLAQPSLSLALTYIDGSVMNGRDLQRCGALTAKAAFVVCDKFAPNIDEEDSQTILRALSIKRYVWEQCEKDIPVFVQLIRPENKQLFVTTMMSHLRYAAAQLQGQPGSSGRDVSGGSGAFSGRGTGSRRSGDGDASSSLRQKSVKDLVVSAITSAVDATSAQLGRTVRPRAGGDRASREDSPGGSILGGGGGESSSGRGSGGGSDRLSDRMDTFAAVGLSSASMLADSAVCVQEVKLNLLAKSALCPGLTALVHNLVMSHNGGDDDGGGDGDGGDGGGLGGSDSEQKWQREYGDGCEYEIYRVPLPSAFEGLAFREASEIIHGETNMVLFALELDVPSARIGSGPRVVLNPGAFVLPGPPFRLHGFVIATDKRDAEVISQVGVRARRRAGSSTTGGGGGPSSSASASSASGTSSSKSAGGKGAPRRGSDETGASAGGEMTAAGSIKAAIDALKARKRAAAAVGLVSSSSSSLLPDADSPFVAEAKQRPSNPPRPVQAQVTIDMGADLLTRAAAALPAVRSRAQVLPFDSGSGSGSNSGSSYSSYPAGEPSVPSDVAPDPRQLPAVDNAGFSPSMEDAPPPPPPLRQAPPSRGPQPAPQPQQREAEQRSLTVGVHTLLRSQQPLPGAVACDNRSTTSPAATAGAVTTPGSLLPADRASTHMRAATGLKELAAAPAPVPLSLKPDARAGSGSTSGGLSVAPRPPSGASLAGTGIARSPVYSTSRSRSPTAGAVTTTTTTTTTTTRPRRPEGPQQQRGSSTAACASAASDSSAHSVLPPLPTSSQLDPRQPSAASSPATSTPGGGGSGIHIADQAQFVEAAVRSKAIRRHIIVCTCDYSSLRSFVAPLRAEHLSEHRAVIVLHPDPPSGYEWSRVAVVEGVYYMQGSPFEAADLMRAGLMTASNVVLFQLSRRASSAAAAAAGGAGPGGRAEAGGLDPNNGDAQYICVYRLIRTLRPDIDVVCEITSRSNISYLSNYSSSADDGGVFATPPFAAGHVFAPDLLDLLLAQAYYNPHLITILTHLVSGGQHAASRNRSWQARCGELGYGGAVDGLSDSQMYLMPVPRQFAGRQYGELFSSMALHFGIVCLGVRRAGSARTARRATLGQLSQMTSGFFSKRKLSVSGGASSGGGGGMASPRDSGADAGPRGRGLSEASDGGAGDEPGRNSMAYVYTNPQRSTRLRAHDRVFVLSAVDPAKLIPTGGNTADSAPPSGPAAAAAAHVHAGARVAGTGRNPAAGQGQLPVPIFFSRTDSGGTVMSPALGGADVASGGGHGAET